MGMLDWIKKSGGGKSLDERPSIRRYGPGEMAYRFEKPFAHMHYLMTPSERKVVEGIEARWREQYEQLKNYPPMSESQEWDTKVFQAIDDVHRALDAREDGHHKDWKTLEANAEKAFEGVRDAFADQRKHLERDLADQKKYAKKLAPDHKCGWPSR